MNTNLRALIFGVAVAATLTVTLDTVTAAEKNDAVQAAVVRLETVQVTAHRDAFDADGNLKPVRLETVQVTAHRNAV